MKNTTAYLIRHGNVDVPLDEKGDRLFYGPEARLNAVGQEKAARLGRDLHSRAVPLDRVFSSPFPRAAETARLIATPFGLPVAVDPRLGDTHAPNLWGTSIEEANRKGPYSYFVQPTPDQEVPEQIDARMLAAYQQIYAESRGQTFVLVSHGDPLTILYYRLCSPLAALPPMVELSKTAPGNVEGFRLVFDPDGNVLEQAYVSQQDGKIAYLSVPR